MGAHETKAVEYGCSVDAITKLCIQLEFEEVTISNILCIIQLDQYAHLHAPMAQARSYLIENGFTQTPVAVPAHTEMGMEMEMEMFVRLLPAESFLPGAPDMSEKHSC